MYRFQEKLANRNNVAYQEQLGWGAIFSAFRIHVLGMTQAEMAEALGTYQGKLCRVENGQRVPPPEILEPFLNMMCDHGLAELKRAERREARRVPPAQKKKSSNELKIQEVSAKDEQEYKELLDFIKRKARGEGGVRMCG